MIFNTGWFLVFFIVFYAAFHLMPGARARFHFTLAASALFQYHFAGPAGVAPILVMAAITYGMGLAIAGRSVSDPGRKRLFLVSLLAPVGGLMFYKYRLLLGTSLGSVLGPSSEAWAKPSEVPLILPLGISFFTFEFVHYLYDVYKGSEPVRNPFRFGFFALFFSSIVAGPIKRYQPFLAQVQEGMARPGFGKVGEGFAQILLGYFKKLVIADSATMAIHLLEKRTDGSPAAVLLLAALLSVRILFDFSGYSDIAIGLGKTVGLELPVNFRYPYISRNISEFWGRWHISLSSWIRDYLYIPLGGNRVPAARRFLNLLIAMFLCGLWHGAQWHFGLWGLYHGLGLGIYHVWERSGFSKKASDNLAVRCAAVALTQVFVAYGWLLFFYPLKEVARLTRTLFGC